MPITYEIHPAIGIARLGSSQLSTEEGYFLGPEPGVSPPARYRDAAGFLKRQAARFRLFACERDDTGKLLDATEVTNDTVRRIAWTVHLVNRKGVARRQFLSGPGFRNQATGDDATDHALIIDAGPRTVMARREPQVFDTGKFRSTPVKLGEIVMQPDGRLLVLGGHGRSGSDPQQPRLDDRRGHFADNDNWFDDTSDGPVTATVELTNGEVVESRAWVVVAPPDFAPGITNLVTLYDLLFDQAVQRGVLKAPTDFGQPLSFTRHIRPILERGMDYRWVNRQTFFGFEDNGRGHGHGGAADFSIRWTALADPSPAAKARRAAVVGALRNPDRGAPLPQVKWLIPRLSDAEWSRTGADNVLPLTPTQYKVMQAWANGDFVNDLSQNLPDDEMLPDALDRMALEACVGGSLYPGLEVNARIRSTPSWFVDGEPFRISHAVVRPGGVTQYNAVPWQTDFLACHWEESLGPMPKRLAWWPAQRPDDVFTSTDAADMVPWTRGLGDEYQDMVDKWDRLGFVVDKGVPEAPFFAESERDEDALGP